MGGRRGQMLLPSLSDNEKWHNTTAKHDTIQQRKMTQSGNKKWHAQYGNEKWHNTTTKNGTISGAQLNKLHGICVCERNVVPLQPRWGRTAWWRMDNYGITNQNYRIMKKTLLNIEYKKQNRRHSEKWLLSREEVLGSMYAGCGVIAVPHPMSSSYENKMMADWFRLIALDLHPHGREYKRRISNAGTRPGFHAIYAKGTSQRNYTIPIPWTSLADKKQYTDKTNTIC